MRAAIVEPTRDGEDQHLVADRLANVGKRVSESFVPGVVVADVLVALRSVPELHLQLDRPMLFVVAKGVLDGILDCLHRGVGTHDNT